MTTLESITITTKEQAELVLQAGVVPEHDRQTVIDDWDLAPLGEFSFMIRGGGFMPRSEDDLGFEDCHIVGDSTEETFAAVRDEIVRKYGNPESFVHEMYLLEGPVEFTVFHNGKVIDWTRPKPGVIET